MKSKILLPLIGLALCGSLTSCGDYSKTDITLSNYKDYVTAMEPLSPESSSAWNFETNSCSAPKDGTKQIFCLYPQFYLTDDQVKDKFFNKFKMDFKVNLYLGKTSITLDDVPDKTITFSSELHYKTYDGVECYYIGFSLNMWTMTYYDKNESSATFDIDVLKSNYELNSYKTTYYREVKLVGVSGTVLSGGLAGANAHHC